MKHAVRIWACRVGGRVLLWCSHCGPMGVSEGDSNAMIIGEHHLRTHGCDVRRSSE